MIRGIVAIDNQRGLTDDKGIPWDLPKDRAYFRSRLRTGAVLMGYGTYLEVKQPLGGGKMNYVATSRHEHLREGFEIVRDAGSFLRNARGDIWNIGGADLLAGTMDLLDELYITQINGDFHCIKFLPEYKDKFTLISESEPQTENNLAYTFQVWRRNNS